MEASNTLFVKGKLLWVIREHKTVSATYPHIVEEKGGGKVCKGILDVDGYVQKLFLIFHAELSKTMVAKNYGHKNVDTKSEQKYRAHF